MGLSADRLKCLQQKEICLLLGVSRMTMLEWGREGLPRNEDRTYCWADVWAWVRRRWAEAKRVEGGDVGKEEDEDLARWRKARADLAEMEVARKRGELVPTEEVAAEVGRLLTEFKGNLLALPQRLAPRLARREPRVVADELDRAIRGVMERSSGKWLGGAQAETKRTTRRKAKSKAAKAAKKTRVRKRA